MPWLNAGTVQSRHDRAQRYDDTRAQLLDRLVDALADACPFCGAEGDQPCYASCEPRD